jgi:hypothetical protein
LAFDVPTLQLIAYSALTCASIIVASVSLFLGFRQNFGWKPIVLYTSYGYGPHDVEEYEVSVEFEVWNRRRYPIVLLMQEVHFRKLTFVQLRKPERSEEEFTTEWGLTERKFNLLKKVLLEPNSHHGFELRAACDLDTPQRIREESTSIRVYYFDPIKNRELIAKSTKIEWKTFADVIRKLPSTNEPTPPS